MNITWTMALNLLNKLLQNKFFKNQLNLELKLCKLEDSKLNYLTFPMLKTLLQVCQPNFHPAFPQIKCQKINKTE